MTLIFNIFKGKTIVFKESTGTNLIVLITWSKNTYTLDRYSFIFNKVIEMIKITLRYSTTALKKDFNLIMIL